MNWRVAYSAPRPTDAPSVAEAAVCAILASIVIDPPPSQVHFRSRSSIPKTQNTKPAHRQHLNLKHHPPYLPFYTPTANMPTTRRKQAATASSRNQSTLSFNSRSARVTKPSIHDTSSAAKKTQPKLSEPAQVDVEETTISTPEPETVSQQPQDEPEISVPIRSPLPTPRKKKPTKSSSTSVSPREDAATKVSDAQLKKYWKAEEDSRLAPRGTLLPPPFPSFPPCSLPSPPPPHPSNHHPVHQSQIPLHEKILRHFDLSSQYGPCIGIPRLARWKRANALGLEPPVEVLAVLLREEDKKTSQGCGKLAYIDELGGGRVGIVE